MRSFALVALVIAACGNPTTPMTGKAPADVAKPALALRKISLLIVPFENRMPDRDKDYFSIGLALALTERLEEISRDETLTDDFDAAGFRLEAVSGPLVLTREQARLRPQANKPFSSDEAYRLAKAKGATHVVTGWYDGRVEKWSMTIELYDVGADSLTFRSRHAESGSIYAGPGAVPKPVHPGIQLAPPHAMMANGLRATLSEEGIVLPEAAVRNIAVPQAPVAMAFIHLARAYDALLRGDGDDAERKALAKAKDAVLVWPECVPAQRLYAHLLYATGKAGEARNHLAPFAGDEPSSPNVRPADYRSLILLGRIEVAQRDFMAAERHLNKAVSMRPLDASAHFHLAEALNGLGRSEQAVASFERAEQLDPLDLETRRRLSALYAARKDYLKAAAELRVIVEREPANLDPVFLLAANLRAGNDLAGAAGAYKEAEARFKEEWRLPLFRGDILRKMGQSGEADAAYEAARAIKSDLPRFGAETPATGGFDLIALARSAETAHERMKETRDAFRDAHNDAVMELRLHGKEACTPERAPASYKLARQSGNAHAEILNAFGEQVRDLKTALEAAEGDFLTVEERTLAETLIVAFEADRREYAEMHAAYDRTLLPMLKRHGCDYDADEVPVADIAAVRARNQARNVELNPDEVRGSSPLSPEIPIGAKLSVNFYVVPPKDGATYELIFAGSTEPEPELIEGKKMVRFMTTFGRHEFCLLEKTPVGAKGPKCGDPGTVRTADFFEGRRIHIK